MSKINDDIETAPWFLDRNGGDRIAWIFDRLVVVTILVLLLNLAHPLDYDARKAGGLINGVTGFFIAPSWNDTGIPVFPSCNGYLGRDDLLTKWVSDTRSMEPELVYGDIVCEIETDSIFIGDMISYDRLIGTGTTIHRFVGCTDSGLILTKGDNCNNVETINKDRIRAKAVARLRWNGTEFGLKNYSNNNGSRIILK